MGATRRWQRTTGNALLLGALAVSGALPPGRVNVAALESEIQDSWIAASSMPVARSEYASAVVDGRIYVIGGQDADSVSSTLVQVYDVARDRWFEAAPAPVALHHAGAAVVGGKIYLIGGFTFPFGERDPVDTVWMYDPAADQWLGRAPLPAPRGSIAVAVVDDRIYAFGGERKRPPGSNPPYVPVDDAAVYDPQTDRWEELPPLRYRRDHLTASAVNGRIYVMGGRDRPAYDLPFNEVLDVATRNWDMRAPMPTGRSGHTAAVLRDRIYTFGGEGNPSSPIGIYYEVEAYDPNTDQWADLSPMPIPRHAVAAVAVGDRIYLPGGSTRRGGSATAIVDAFAPVDR